MGIKGYFVCHHNGDWRETFRRIWSDSRVLNPGHVNSWSYEYDKSGYTFGKAPRLALARVYVSKGRKLSPKLHLTRKRR